MTDTAIVVQNFNKPDTLGALCKSLLECDNTRDLDLIFWSDSAIGARKEAEYLPKCAEVGKLLDSFFVTYRDRFRSITLRRNSTNLGCYKTCQLAIESAFEEHDFVIFSEDDTIFSPDALDWFIAMKDSPAFLDDAIWAIAGESIFFDGQRTVPARQLVESAKIHAAKHHLWEQFIPLDFIPSTCFATNRHKWAQISVTRGQINGDVELCHRCQAEGKKCLFPVVARVKDTGMLHPDGYSVSIHTADNVTGVKNCYLMSSDIRPGRDVTPEVRRFDGDAGLLYWRSTMLNGFEETAKSDTELAKESDLLENARRAGLDGDWDSALALWRELKKGGMVNPEVNSNIGLCLLKLGEREKARAVIRHVLALNPDDSYAQSIMAYILEGDSAYNDAAEIWSQLRQRTGLPEWLAASAVSGELRCKAASVAMRPNAN
jgi:tetratricopeptide (TPR) repeat protein